MTLDFTLQHAHHLNGYAPAFALLLFVLLVCGSKVTGKNVYSF